MRPFRDISLKTSIDLKLLQCFSYFINLHNFLPSFSSFRNCFCLQLILLDSSLAIWNVAFECWWLLWFFRLCLLNTSCRVLVHLFLPMARFGCCSHMVSKVFIDQSTFGRWCGQYCVGRLYFSRIFAGTQLRFGRPGSQCDIFKSHIWKLSWFEMSDTHNLKVAWWVVNAIRIS